jgi:hypothetical protein
MGGGDRMDYEKIKAAALEGLTFSLSDAIDGEALKDNVTTAIARHCGHEAIRGV